MRWRHASAPHVATLALVVVLSLGVRLVGIRHGLPHAYNADEELHFVPQARRPPRGTGDPGYFENPSGFTYAVAAVLRVAFARRDVPQLLLDDPGAVFLAARVVAALLGTAAVAATYWAGRRLVDPVAGVWAAAFSGLAFLPVFYAHHALNDAATLLPLALALVAVAGLHRDGRWRDAVAAGALVGVATGVKYLAAPMAAVIALALLLRVLDGRQGLVAAGSRLAAAAAASVAGLLALNPYIALHAGQFWREFAGQSSQASTGKLGQDGSAWADYPLSLLWGFGAVPAVLALAGALLVLRRDRALGLLLVTFPVLLYVSMAGQGRWFGRWLLPAYPVLAVLAGCAARRTTVALARRVPTPVAVGVVALVALAQPAVDVVRSDLLLTRTDTRQEALDRVLAEVPIGSRLVVEPAFPATWTRALVEAGLEVRPVPRPFQAYEERLEPELLDDYRAEGACWVVVSGHQRDRGLAARAPGAVAYYRRLAAEGDRVLVASPYADGVTPPAFSYDFSFTYYPLAHRRPGPVVELHRLTGC